MSRIENAQYTLYTYEVSRVASFPPESVESGLGIPKQSPTGTQ
jgi:hypothetical protein